MILSTHAIVGGAVASLLPSHPALAAVAGFASHFAIDAIPHWDYPLSSISTGRGADNRGLKIDRDLLLDLMLIGFDALAGLALAIWLFATPATTGVITLGACAAILPDPLQFAQSLFPGRSASAPRPPSPRRYPDWQWPLARLTTSPNPRGEEAHAPEQAERERGRQRTVRTNSALSSDDAEPVIGPRSARTRWHSPGEP